MNKSNRFCCNLEIMMGKLLFGVVFFLSVVCYSQSSNKLGFDTPTHKNKIQNQNCPPTIVSEIQNTDNLHSDNFFETHESKKTEFLAKKIEDILQKRAIIKPAPLWV